MIRVLNIGRMHARSMRTTVHHPRPYFSTILNATFVREAERGGGTYSSDIPCFHRKKTSHASFKKRERLTLLKITPRAIADGRKSPVPIIVLPTVFPTGFTSLSTCSSPCPISSNISPATRRARVGRNRCTVKTSGRGRFHLRPSRERRHHAAVEKKRQWTDLPTGSF